MRCVTHIPVTGHSKAICPDTYSIKSGLHVSQFGTIGFGIYIYLLELNWLSDNSRNESLENQQIS